MQQTVFGLKVVVDVSFARTYPLSDLPRGGSLVALLRKRNSAVSRINSLRVFCEFSGLLFVESLLIGLLHRRSLAANQRYTRVGLHIFSTPISYIFNVRALDAAYG